MRSIFVLTILLAGCAATGPKYDEYQSKVSPVKSDASRVIFYRNSRFMAGGADAVVYINEKKVGECGDGKYFYVDVSSGPAKIKAEMKASPGSHTVENKFEKGETYYYEVQVNEAFIHSGVMLGLIGQSAYVASNENSAAWIFSEKAKEIAEKEIKDKVFSIDGE